MTITTDVLCQGCKAQITSGSLCGECLQSLVTLLAQAPGLLDELDVTISRQARLVEHIGGRSAERPLPWDPRAAMAHAALGEALSRWAGAHDIRSEGHGVALLGAPRACARYLRRLPLINLARHDRAGEMMRELQTLQARALRAIDRPADRWYAGACAVDGCPADLYARHGAATVRCPTCGCVHDVQTRRAWLLESVHDALATATEIGRAVRLLGEPIKPQRLWDWRRRGRLIIRGRNAAGEPLYRVGDVLYLLAHDPRHKA